MLPWVARTEIQQSSAASDAMGVYGCHLAMFLWSSRLGVRLVALHRYRALAIGLLAAVTRPAQT